MLYQSMGEEKMWKIYEAVSDNGEWRIRTSAEVWTLCREESDILTEIERDRIPLHEL